MKICYFGTYSLGEGYPQNKVIIEGLKRNGVEVIECHQDLWKGAADKVRGARSFRNSLNFLNRWIIAYVLLIIKFFKIKEYDFIIVGFTGHFDIFLAKILNLFRKRPIIFNALFSLYDTVVNDRKLLKPNSLMAKFLWMVDKYSCLISDLIFLDTNEHIKYFVEEFGVPEQKFFRVPVGEDDMIFKPFDKEFKKDRFEILFFGTYISLQGVDFIVQSAKQLEYDKDIHFILIGTGQLYDEVDALAKKLNVNNIEFVNHWVDYKSLVEYIAKADVCLGIFGISEKAQRVVPCKVYDCLAMGKAIITGDSPAAREFLVNKESAILCEMGDASSIARSILLLKEDRELLRRLEKNAIYLFRNNFTIDVIGKSIVERLKSMRLNKDLNPDNA